MIATNAIISSGGGGGGANEPDFADYLTRLSGITGAAIAVGTEAKWNQLCLDIASIRTKIGRLSLWRTDRNNFLAAPVPFLRSFDGINVRGNALDTLTNWISADFDATGLGDAANATKYVSGNYQADGQPETGQDDFSFGIFSNDTVAYDNIYDMGTLSSTQHRIVAINWLAIGARSWINDFSASVIAPVGGNTLTAISRVAPTVSYLFNSANSFTSGTASALSVPLQEFIFSLNNAGAPFNFAPRKFMAYFFGKGLTVAELTLLNNAIVTFYT